MCLVAISNKIYTRTTYNLQKFTCMTTADKYASSDFFDCLYVIHDISVENLRSASRLFCGGANLM